MSPEQALSAPLRGFVMDVRCSVRDRVDRLRRWWHHRALPVVCLLVGLVGLHEGAWAEPPSMRFAPEQAYPPFVYDGPNGQPIGLSVDLLRAVEPKLGFSLRWEPSAPLSDILQAAQEGRVDLISSLRPTPERSRYLSFTSSYVAVPAVLVTRGGSNAADLTAFAGKPVAVGKGYAVEAFVRSRFPQVVWREVTDDEVGLRQLRAGEVEGWVADVGSVRHLFQQERVKDLVVGAPVGFEYALSFGYRTELAAWGQQLDRALRDLDPVQRREIVNRWLDPEAARYQNPIRRRWQVIALAALALAAMVAAVVWWRTGRNAR